MGSAIFRVHYATQWGQRLFFERVTADQGRIAEIPMHHDSSGFWFITVPELRPGELLQYRYQFRDSDGSRRKEPVFRRAEIFATGQVVWDHFLSPELPDGAFLRQAFAGVIFSPSRSAEGRMAAGSAILRITMRAPRVSAGQRLCLSGRHPLLGDWDPALARVMSGQSYPVWELDLPAMAFSEPFEFKFGIWDQAQERLVSWEEGPNRIFHGIPAGTATLVVNYEQYRHPQAWRGAGVAIPVFSLRTERSYGIGEFLDLIPFAEWAARCKFHMVQLLPVNDTSSDYSWSDSYPYKAISTAALHPVYLNIERLYEDHAAPLPQGYFDKRVALNRLPQVDYETVIQDKVAYLRRLFTSAYDRANSDALQRYVQDQAGWLQPYAAFCRLRDLHGTADFARWGPHAKHRAREVETWFNPGAPEHREVMFHCWVQFHLDRQLGDALKAGHARGVAFKGDLPIGINRSSVEAWIEPELFRMDRQTGAPPDAFAVLGQNWGFPTYNWSRMEADDYAWWRKRFHRMAAAFDALRIDHILGFFRIWEIPQQYREGILGHFNPALPLTREEVRQAGFDRDPSHFTTGAVAEGRLADIFGPPAVTVRRELLVKGKDEFYRLRPEFGAVDARKAWYSSLLSPAEAESVEAGITRLGFEVLFLEDPDQPGRFHPRINVEQTVLFGSLPEREQAALRRLHDDFYFRRHTIFWAGEAMKKLPALMDASPMLICGEDLGMVPDSVPLVLKQLGLLSLEVQRWPKVMGLRLGKPAEYPYLSVCTTSTHDMSTLRGWWEEEADTRQYFWKEILRQDGTAPPKCSGSICRFIVEQNLAAASMWCILPLQDWLGIDEKLRHPVTAEERINVPANPNHYWRYRMHLNIEELLRADGLNRAIEALVEAAGRNQADGDTSKINSPAAP